MPMNLILLLAVGAIQAVNIPIHDLEPRQTPAVSCATLQPSTIPNATVVSVEAAERRNFVVPGGIYGATPIPPLDFCDVNVTLTHGIANDSVRIEVWMPLTGWNGRFQGTGGGGYAAGSFGNAMAPQVAAGFSAASTDAGLPPPSPDVSGLVFTDQQMENFAFLSVHEMALVGKAMSQQFYGTGPKFSYWNGCSTGGRQGYMEAQTFPEDFDGILAVAPAISWDKFCPAEYWPFLVQSEANEFVPPCVFTALTQATIQACDGLDGGMDGLISDPSVCQFDANSVVGKAVQCDNTPVTISASQASIYNGIINGPVDPTGARLWFGVEPGTDFNSLSGTTPLGLASIWLDTFAGNRTQLGGQFSRNNTISAQTYSNLFQASIASKFGRMLATDNADLSRLNSTGHKLLSWHGLADPIIVPQGTFDYRQRVEAMMNGSDAVDQFYRLFIAPGVSHCGGGGPSPDTATALDVLINWVENGVAPDTLPANITVGSTTVTRNLCRFPLVAHFRGTGNVNSAAAWTCIPSQGQLAGTGEKPGGASMNGAWSGWMTSTFLLTSWLVI